MVEQTVTCFKPEMRDREVTFTVFRPIPREVQREYKTTVMVPVYRDEKQTRLVPSYVPREVEREVAYCQMVPTTCIDPCTGCPVTVCKPQTVVQKYKMTVYDCVPKSVEVTVRVCSYKSEERTWRTKCFEYDFKEEKITRKQYYCVMVPYQSKVAVPVVCPE